MRIRQLTKHLPWLLGGFAALLAFCFYIPAYHYISGYLDMTAWANPDVITNFTVGFIILLAMFGMTVGAACDIFLRRMGKQRRRVLTLIIVFIATLGVCWLLSELGMVEGFRFA